MTIFSGWFADPQEAIKPAAVGLGSIAAAIVGDQVSGDPIPTLWRTALFVSGVILVILGASGTWRWTRDKAGNLTGDARLLLGVSNILALFLFIATLSGAFALEVFNSDNPAGRFEAAILDYRQAIEDGDEDTVLRASFAIFAACEDVDEIGNVALRVTVRDSCVRLLEQGELTRDEVNDILVTIATLKGTTKENESPEPTPG